MPTIEEEKRAKPRPPRSRKTADQRTTPKAEQKAQAPDQDHVQDQVHAQDHAQAGADAPSDPVSPGMAPIEAAAVDAEPVLALETASEAALIGEVLPPEIRNPVPVAAGLPAIAQAYDDYTRKSWLTGRFMVERLITVRSFDEAIEIQGEFAKQAYANFLTHSERICVLYGEWAQQFFRPFDKFATRIGR
jgi:hypothetical protein